MASPRRHRTPASRRRHRHRRRRRRKSLLPCCPPPLWLGRCGLFNYTHGARGRRNAEMLDDAPDKERPHCAASDDYTADILVEGERIRAIGLDLPVGSQAEMHDAAGLLVLPGGVDPHTHLDWDFGVARTADTFGSGTKAAAFGGTTTLIDFANQNGRSLPEALDDWHGRAASGAIDVAAHLILTQVTDQTLVDMRTMIRREGVSSFKLFLAYPGV